MHYRKLTYLLILTILLCAGCSEDKNHKEYFPGKNGEKPTEKNSMYEGENTEDLKGFVSKYYVAGPPMKFLLKIVQLDASAYRLQISNYPGRECTLCRDFSSSIDSELSAANQ